MSTKTATATDTRPSAVMSSSTISDDVPRALTADDLIIGTTVQAQDDDEPKFGPPGTATDAALAEGIGAWKVGAKVGALFASNQNRNGWMWVVGTGWKKLGGTTDLAHTGLCQLARLARDTNASINYRDEADGLVHEIYVW